MWVRYSFLADAWFVEWRSVRNPAFGFFVCSSAVDKSDPTSLFSRRSLPFLCNTLRYGTGEGV